MAKTTWFLLVHFLSDAAGTQSFLLSFFFFLAPKYEAISYPIGILLIWVYFLG